MKGRVRAYFSNCTKKGVKRCLLVPTEQETMVSFYYLKLQRYPNKGTCPKNQPTNQSNTTTNNKSQCRRGRRKKKCNATNELIPFGVSEWWRKLVKQETMAESNYLVMGR